jgi:hypothetical protein
LQENLLLLLCQVESQTPPQTKRGGLADVDTASDHQHQTDCGIDLQESVAYSAKGELLPMDIDVIGKQYYQYYVA